MQAVDTISAGPREVVPALRRPKLMDLERAKGLMMILVVIGHTYDPAGPEWSTILRRLIYSFHMPFFMYLSGFLFVYSGAHVLKADFGRYVWKRARRLLLPFLVMAIVIISLKVASERYVVVNKPVGDMIHAYYSIFIGTRSSPVVTIWYLFVLFVYSALVPILFSIFRGRWTPLLVLGLATHCWFVLSLYYGGLTDDLYIDRIFWFLLYFAVGCWAASRMESWLPFVDRWWPLFLVPMLLLLPLMLQTEWRYLVVGLLSVPAIHGLMRSRWIGDNAFLAMVGGFTMVIYLTNTLFVGVVRGVFAKVAPPSEHMLLLYLCTLPVALFGPMALRAALDAIPPTRPLALYLK